MGRGQKRIYYIAVEETTWDYAPPGRDLMVGKNFGEPADVFVKRGPNRIDATYKKVQYVKYADATFTKRKPRPPELRYPGIVGPIIHAEVGDKIRIVSPSPLAATRQCRELVVGEEAVGPNAAGVATVAAPIGQFLQAQREAAASGVDPGEAVAALEGRNIR